MDQENQVLSYRPRRNEQARGIRSGKNVPDLETRILRTKGREIMTEISNSEIIAIALCAVLVLISLIAIVFGDPNYYPLGRFIV